MGRIRHLWIEGDKPGIIVVDVDPPLADGEIEIRIDMEVPLDPELDAAWAAAIDGCSSPLDETSTCLSSIRLAEPASSADDIALGAMIAMTARRHP